MSTLYFVRQPRAALIPKMEFYQAPDLAWYARALPSASDLALLQEADIQAELLDDGVNVWERLHSSEQLDKRLLSSFYGDVGTALYPLARLAPQGAPPLLSTSESHREACLASELTLARLARNRQQVSPAARKHLGAGRLAFSVPADLELALVELELSDGSVVLAWAWGWRKRETPLAV